MSTDALGDVLADAQRIGLLGPDPVEHHMLHARAWARALTPGRFLDLGSGAGVPGLVLALEWPDVTGALLDGQVRRTTWLRAAIARLGLTDRIAVVEGRADDLAHDTELRESFPIVFARGFGPPAATAECGSGFTAAHGILTVSEPPGGPAGRWPIQGLTRLGLEISGQIVQSSGSFVILRKHASLEAEFPRRRNLPLKSPLWS